MLAGVGSNSGLGIIILKDWEERTTQELSLKATVQRLQGQLWALPDAQIMVFNPPPIPFSQASGFEFQLQDAHGATSKNWLKYLIHWSTQPIKTRF